AGRCMGAALIARLVLWSLTLLLALAIAGPLGGPFSVTTAMGLALVLFTLSIGISNLAAIGSAVLNGHELMEYPALVTVLTSVMKLSFGAWALLNGYGIVGVAVVAIVVTIISDIVLIGLLVLVLGGIKPLPDGRFALQLGRSSYPLMINDFLAMLFF